MIDIDFIYHMKIYKICLVKSKTVH